MDCYETLGFSLISVWEGFRVFSKFDKDEYLL